MRCRRGPAAAPSHPPRPRLRRRRPPGPAGGAHLAVPPPEDHSKGPVSHEVPLAVLEVAHHLHGRAPGSARAGGRAAISTAGPPAPSAPAGRRAGAAEAPGPSRRSCLQAGRKRGGAAQGRGQRGLARPRPLLMPATAGRGLPGEAGPLTKRAPWRSGLGAAGQGRCRLRHWASPGPRARPGEVQAPAPLIPALRRLGLPAGTAQRRPPPFAGPAQYPTAQPRSDPTRARRPLRADCRPSATSAHLLCRSTRRGRRAPSAGKMSAQLLMEAGGSARACAPRAGSARRRASGKRVANTGCGRDKGIPVQSGPRACGEGKGASPRARPFPRPPKPGVTLSSPNPSAFTAQGPSRRRVGQGSCTSWSRLASMRS